MRKTTTRQLSVFFATCFAVSAFAQTSKPETQVSGPEYRLEIERQPVAEALTELAKQTGLQIGYPRETPTETILVGPLSGRYTADAAMTLLLSTSGLTFERLNERTIAVTRPASAKSKRRGAIVATELKTEHREESSFTRVADLRLADGPATKDVRPVAAAGVGESTSEKSRRLRGMEEVVVTAQKRAERLQDVPVSIAALTADEIDRRGFVSGEDYLRGMAGVNQVVGGFGGTVVIRGIDTSPGVGSNGGKGGTVATYFGETPTTSSAGILGAANVDLKLVDIERVEVLRGPQGTAFGNASMGGAVRTIPVAPKLNSFEGRVGASYSVTSGSGDDNQMIQAVANIPLIRDKLAVRATAYRFEDSGYYRNVAGSDPLFQGYSATVGAQAFAVDNDDIGATRFTGGRIAALWQAAEDLSFTLTYLTQKTEVDGWPHAGTGSLATAGFATLDKYDQALWQIAPQQVNRGERAGGRDTDIDLLNATMEFGLGWGSLLTTVSHIESGGVITAPMPFPIPFSQRNVSTHRETSGEIRLVTQLDGAWNFLGGVYAEDVKDPKAWSDYYWFGTPALNPFSSTPFIGLFISRQAIKQKAAFAEVSWEVLPHVTLTGGGRYYDYTRENITERSGPLFGNSITPTKGDESGTNYKANLSYKPNDDALIYAGWAQGFRLGVPGPGLPAGLCDTNNDGIIDGTGNVTIESTKFLDSDSVDSYEIGTKLALLDRRLTIAAAVYHIDWNGVPFSVRAPAAPNGCGRPYAVNANRAISEGIELETNFQLTDALRISVGGSKTQAEIAEDVPNLVIPVSDGDRLPGSPEYTANLGLQYMFSVGGHEAFVRADSIYVGHFFSSSQFLESSQTKAGGYVKVDLAARIAIRNLDINLFVRNLTNDDSFTMRDSDGVASGEMYGYRLIPRTVGVQLDYSF